MTQMSVLTPFLSQSFAYQRFKKQHTLCSEYYWHTILTKAMACKFSRNIQKTDSPCAILNNAHFPNTFAQWGENISNVENWLRLNILLVSNSYFEQYFFEIVNLLLSNRPTVLLGDHKTINGVYYLKNNISPKEINDLCEKITKGPWAKRREILKEIICDDCFLDDDISTLDKIRKMRNKIAHRFGHDFIPNLRDFFCEHPQDRLSEERLLKLLKFIEDTAKKIDKFLLPFIGNFELLLLWHLHKNDHLTFFDPEQKLKTIVNEKNVDTVISLSQAKELLNYYNSF